MGFVATEAIEALDYDFTPHVDAKGTIPEPSADAVETFRNHVMGAVRSSGLDPDMLASGRMQVSLDMMDDLLAKADGVEEEMLVATADLTGIDAAVLRRLPFRVRAAFMGWIMGQFFSPEG